MLIHPQYIIALCDCGFTEFKLFIKKNQFQFEVDTYSNNIQLLYKIKDRFKTGKIIILENELEKVYCLKITKNLDKIIEFYLKNKLLNKIKHITFLRWQYLYQKLILEKDKKKTDKELNRIQKRLKYFCMI